MASESATDVLLHARELERRDALIAAELAVLNDLAERAGVARAGAARVREALEHLPAQRQILSAAHGAADDELTAARAALEAARSKLASLEQSRRRRPEELARAEKQAATAADAVTDAESRLERIDGQASELRATEELLVADGELLVAAAAGVSAELGRLARVAESTVPAAGAGLGELEEWGGHVRSALFVARGTLEQERERIVLEANALGSAVLGEQLGGSSATVVRQRLEAMLA